MRHVGIWCIPPGGASIATAMSRKTAHANQWLRYLTVVAALFWALGVAAGCHLPHTATAAPHTSSMSTAAIGHNVTALAQQAPVGAGSCSPMGQGCKHVAQACSITDLVALAVVVAVVILAGSLAWPVVSVPRGPPQPNGFVPHRPGRNILTRHCIARI